MKHRKTIIGIAWTGLLLGITSALPNSASFAAPACPPGTESSTACIRWQTTLQRLETAAKEAEAVLEASEPATSDTPSREARAKAVVDGILNLFTQFNPEAKLEIARDYTLTADGDVYRVRFDKAAFVKDAVTVQFHPFTVTVQPREDGLSLVGFRIGDTVSVREDTREILQILIGKQEHTGIWNQSLENFTHTDLQLDEVQAVVTEPSMKLGLGKLHLSGALVPGKDGAWNQSLVTEVTDIGAQAEDSVVRLARLTSQFSVEGHDYPKYLQLNKDLTALNRQDPEDPQVAQRALQLAGDLFGLLVRLDSSFIATGLTAGDAQQTLATLDAATLSFGFDARSGGGSALDYEMEMAGLQTASPGIPNNLLPTDMRLQLGLDNIPSKLFSRMLEIASTAEQLEDQEARDMYLNQQVLAMIMESQLSLYVKNSFIKARDARADLNMRTTADPQAALGATGEMHLRIEGLPKLIEATADLGGEEQEQGPAQFLAVLAAFSERTQENGKTIDTFDCKFTNEGRLWLNGKDITAMFMTPQEEAPTEQAPQ